MNLKIGSLFDGSGGFPLAGTMCGIEPVWASEIEPFPIAVTSSRFPKMKHLGSITDINGAEVEPVDIITFGSPCQDLSVAGKRAGLKHTENGDDETTRSGLFMEAVRIIKEMRKATNGEYPRYAVWENVPGAFSSNKGGDFRVVLEELIRIAEPTAVMPDVPKAGWSYADVYCGDGWSLAYRVLDAQYWGVPQRRRRIYLVADFRGQRAGKILFEREGLRGNFAKSGAPWQAVAGDAEGSIGADDREGNSGVRVLNPWDSQGNQVHDGTGNNVYPCLRGCGGAGYQAGYVLAEGNTEAVPYTLKIRGGVEVDSAGKSAGKGALIQTNMSATLGTSQDQYLFQPVTYGISSYESNAMKSANPHSGIYEANTARTLDLNGGNPACNQGGIAIVEPIPCTLEPGIAAREGGHIYEGVSGTLRANAGDNQMAVAYPVPNILLDDQGGQQINVRTDDKCPTLRAEAHGNMPAVVGVDLYNQVITGDVSKSMTASASDADHVPCVAYSIENHPADSRVNIDDSGKVQTLTSRMGTGGGNVPMVMEQKPVYPIEGNGARPSHLGDGYSESDKMYTLNTIERHAVAYGIETFHCNTEEEKVPTLKARDWKDPHVVVYWDGTQTCGTLTANNAGGNQRMPDKENFNCVIQEDPIAIDRAYFNQGQNALYDPQLYADGTNPTLVARGPNAVAVREGENSVAYSFDPGASRDVGVLFIEECGKTLTNGTCPGHHDGVVIHDKVAVRYIVRRLTPTECARLQGFPDNHGHPDPKENFTDEEYSFWLNVRNTHAEINGKAIKEYTKEQMLKWYNGLHTDSAEYKMWGNGIALPCALYVMEGIANGN